MTNGTMFAYAYGILLKQGTAHAWSAVARLSQENEKIKEWFDSQYVKSASGDKVLLELLDKHGL